MKNKNKARKQTNKNPNNYEGLIFKHGFKTILL